MPRIRNTNYTKSCAYVFALFAAAPGVKSQSHQCIKQAVTRQSCPVTANPGLTPGRATESEVAMSPFLPLLGLLAEVPDPRRGQGQKYRLPLASPRVAVLHPRRRDR